MNWSERLFRRQHLNDERVAGSQIYYVVQYDPKRNYVGQWNLNIQHQFPGDVTVLAGYVGSRGIHMWFQADGANLILPTRAPLGYIVALFAAVCRYAYTAGRHG